MIRQSIYNSSRSKRLRLAPPEKKKSLFLWRTSINEQQRHRQFHCLSSHSSSLVDLDFGNRNRNLRHGSHLPFVSITTTRIQYQRHHHYHEPHSHSRRHWKSSLAEPQPKQEPEQQQNISIEGEDIHQISPAIQHQIEYLQWIRNVGILAHVDAGKTTVTERMLELAGVVRRAGCVDHGTTVTDFLPAERERGITIQSAAISFPWQLQSQQEQPVSIHLIDTPGHVDFSVEVNRSVAVLDSAVLVVDAVAGVQAQTETVWRAMRMQQEHEPLPCLAVVNKMDKEGCHYGHAISSLAQKLPGANPILLQIPLFSLNDDDEHDHIDPDASLRLLQQQWQSGQILAESPFAIDNDENKEYNNRMASAGSKRFCGVIDLVHMNAILYPTKSNTNRPQSQQQIEPLVISLLDLDQNNNNHKNLVSLAQAYRQEFLVAPLANVDEEMEEMYLMEETVEASALARAIRSCTLQRLVLPVLAAAALDGKGVDLILDAISLYLASPLDRKPPSLTKSDKDNNDNGGQYPLGHPLSNPLLALAFKVVHMKGGRGGSGDGRVVFARVYSGQIQEGQVLEITNINDTNNVARTERVGGMLELAGGQFDNLEGGTCPSGHVCALIGLKSVVTGDTLTLVSDNQQRKKSNDKSKKKSKKKKRRGGNDHNDNDHLVCLAGVASPPPVLTVKLETESTQEQEQLDHALSLLTVEDPSLVVDQGGDTIDSTLLSGLGELHIDVVLDRLRREYNLNVMAGTPSVTYRQSIVSTIETDGLVNFDKTIGNARMQAAVHLQLEPLHEEDLDSTTSNLMEPVIFLSPSVEEYLGFPPESLSSELIHQMGDEVAQAIVLGCKGAMSRGVGFRRPNNNNNKNNNMMMMIASSFPLTNVACTVVNIHADGGLPSLRAMPGAIQAAAANAMSNLLGDNTSQLQLLEPTMNIQITTPQDMVGTVLADLNGRRGHIDNVDVGSDDGEDAEKQHHFVPIAAHHHQQQQKSLITAQVPLVEILGYASSLRSLTGGEASFTAEYKGHAACDYSTLKQ